MKLVSRYMALPAQSSSHSTVGASSTAAGAICTCHLRSKVSFLTSVTVNPGPSLDFLRSKLPGPTNEIEKWESGAIISVDYRLLLPSSGHDINEDMISLFEYLLTLPIEHHKLFLAGFSGGGYPLRLAAIQGALESQRPSPRFKVCGWISFSGMGGNFFLDHWLLPHRMDGSELYGADRDKQEEIHKKQVDFWLDPAAPEVSDAPYQLHGDEPGRALIWDYLHVFGNLCDLIAGEPGLSQRLVALPQSERSAAVPDHHRAVFPQIYIEQNARFMPPCLLIHGNNDAAVPFDESMTTLKVLDEGGGNVEMIVIEGGNHALHVGGQVPQETQDAYVYTAEWMLKQLK
jgi:acetyl esterase/lipase